MRKKLLSILALSILVASTLIGCSQGSPCPSTPTILSITEGNVSVMKAGTDDWIEAEVGMSLEVGDNIKTGDDSGAEITFFDGSTMELEAGTEIEIVSLDMSCDTGSTTITLEQMIGDTISRVTRILDPASRYEIETPTGVVGVRGSGVRVQVIFGHLEYEDGTTLVTNLEGNIYVIAQGVELQVPKGQQCIIRPSQLPELIIVEVIFADPNLEAAVRDAIDIPTGPIYSLDFVELTYLDGSERNITDLTGLEYATSLTELGLTYNQISDISPLTNLISLTTVDLWFNQITDISPLADLTNLTTLNLVNNQIIDISPLANLTSLTGLWLHDNQISDISPLANLTTLTGLGLNRNQIGDISPLAGLTNLTLGLWLAHNQISDISPLANLTSLTELYLGSNQISDISPLANLTSLARLELADNGISYISPLADLNSLTRLYLWDNQISDISPLANLTSLTELDLHSNQISDILALVQNAGLGTGDTINLEVNPLSSDSITIYIPQLEERGVTVTH